MLILPKYNKYQDVNRHVTLRSGIEGITPYEIELPEPPPPEQIINFGLPIEKQFFQREIIPAWVWKMTREANKKGKDGRKSRQEVMKIASTNSTYNKFIGDQFEKRKNGVWMYIRGVPTYITRKHWHYCSYYYLDDGLPMYKDVDRDYYYWWELYIEPSPYIYGGQEMTMRRDGKSYRFGNCLLFDGTETRNFHAGILSKTSEDAKDLFQRTIVLPWRRLPFYFSPKYDNKSYPIKEINFRDPDSELDYDEDDTLLDQISTDELNSTIEARSTVHTAFDGAKLKRFFLDEAGKIEEMLVSDAWRVHKQCLRVGHHIIGKAMLTSTVEETTKGGLAEYKKIWLQSDHAKDKLTDLGQTKSGLVRYFKPSWETIRVDQYGASVIDDPKDYQREYFEKNPLIYPHPEMGGRELVDKEIHSVDDPSDRQKMIHMYPRTVKEALSSNPKDCEFNSININTRLEDFVYGNDEVVVGNLEWENNIRFSRVIFRATPNGRWKFKKSVMDWIIATSNNIQIHTDGRPMPGFKHLGCIGADPYKYNATNTERKSLGTAMAYMDLNLNLEESLEQDYADYQSDDYVMQYGYRHSDKKRYHEDMVMSCWFLGFPIFPEINVSSLWDYFVENGLEHFLKYRNLIKKNKRGTGVRIEKSKTPGMTTLGDSIKEPVFTLVGNYIDTYCHKCVFEEFLNDCLNVEYDDWSPSDYFVAGGYARYGVKGVTRKPVEENKARSFNGMWKPNTY